MSRMTLSWQMLVWWESFLTQWLKPFITDRGVLEFFNANGGISLTTGRGSPRKTASRKLPLIQRVERLLEGKCLFWWESLFNTRRSFTTNRGGSPGDTASAMYEGHR
jgi:hypothetical protein